jgi:hypothetical protein
MTSDSLCCWAGLGVMIDFFSNLPRIGAASFLSSQMLYCKKFICNMKLSCSKTSLSEKYGTIGRRRIEVIANSSWEKTIHARGPILNSNNEASSYDLVASNAF